MDQQDCKRAERMPEESEIDVFLTGTRTNGWSMSRVRSDQKRGFFAIMPSIVTFQSLGLSSFYGTKGTKTLQMIAKSFHRNIAGKRSGERVNLRDEVAEKPGGGGCGRPVTPRRVWPT